MTFEQALKILFVNALEITTKKPTQHKQRVKRDKKTSEKQVAEQNVYTPTLSTQCRSKRTHHNRARSHQTMSGDYERWSKKKHRQVNSSKELNKCRICCFNCREIEKKKWKTHRSEVKEKNGTRAPPIKGKEETKSAHTTVNIKGEKKKVKKRD
ncbi:hypothetical protein RUM43_009354 [Polyplax serrata]|uniref:Uncharacterized protein n=1 Tax=Polyplax serrata TaxID=468196 RepID=A0AAN8NVZ7_POLSC